MTFLLCEAGATLINIAKDSLDNAIEISPDFIVPEPQHMIALFGNHLVTFRVVLALMGLIVLPAVKFDCKLRTVLGKIQKVSVKRNLPAKMISVSVCFPQLPPKQAFRFRFAVAQLARSRDRSYFQSAPHRRSNVLHDLPLVGGIIYLTQQS